MKIKWNTVNRLINPKRTREEEQRRKGTQKISSKKTLNPTIKTTLMGGV